MSEFKRSPSKVWWVEDTTSWRLESSASPGSQDSGFSDSEILPAQKTILRELSKSDSSKTKNTNEQYKEKPITDKNLPFQTNKSTPKTALYEKRTRKNLFSSKTVDPSSTTTTTIKANTNNQYAKGDKCTKSQQQISSKVTFNGTLQESISTTTHNQLLLNRSAPAVLGVLKENEERTEEENVDGGSDCDSEIESFFRGAVESPKHTSTPKSAGRGEMMRQCKRKAALNLHQAKFQRERYV